jgi:uncharacterized protein (DUF1800 family)
MLSASAIHAANRFGLGIRPQDAAAIEADPRRWLIRQLPAQGTAAPLPPALMAMPGVQVQAGRFLTYRGFEQAGRTEAQKAAQQQLQQGIQAEVVALFEAQRHSDTPFVERWVQFWANHFAIGGRNGFILVMAGAYEREAIRAHAFGRFADMLVAATWHPAMLVYLDNAASFGPSSKAGVRRQVGLTENHAREILELHTIGRDAGYTQADVIALAKMLTGWSVGRTPQDGCTPGLSCFRAVMHEPGPQTLLGQSFGQQVSDQGEAALRMLAARPETAQQVATKLARHFIADDPPAEAVAALARVFRDSDGDLRQLALMLISRPEAWQPGNRKLRSPRDFLLAALRLTDADIPTPRCAALLRQFGQPTFQPPSPAGWPDRAADWLAPDALRQRIELAYVLGQRARSRQAPQDLLDLAIGASARPDTRQAVQRAESRPAALATLLAAPDFQWR